MQQGEAARHPSGSVGPCRISFHSLNTRARERRRCPFPSGGNRGTEGLGPLPEGSVFCLRDPCSELDASGASLGHTSRLCTDQPRWALTRASVGAHTGIPWSSHGHPLEVTRSSLGAHAGIPWSCIRIPTVPFSGGTTAWARPVAAPRCTWCPPWWGRSWRS